MITPQAAGILALGESPGQALDLGFAASGGRFNPWTLK